jgi:hexosaminidase
MNDRLSGLVPVPQSARSQPGTLPLTAVTVTPASGSAGAAAQEAAAAVQRVMARIPWPGRPGQEPAGTSQPAGAGQPASSPAADAPAPVTVGIAADLAAEAYRLDITPAGITIEAGTPAGAFYAAQTLRQLLPDDAWRSASTTTATKTATAATAAGTAAPGAWAVPCATIHDAPALAWRGAHIDVARHFFPKRQILTLIDALAALKLNRLHLHLTDDQGWRIESRRYPALHEIGSHRPRTRLSHSKDTDPVYDESPHGGYYTLADLSEITAYAAQQMITVVPEIEVPGHAAALLAALPELGSGTPPGGGYQVIGDWGIFPWLMSPLPRTREFLHDIFGELLAAMPVPYVHIGGDECVLDSWRADPVIDAYRRDRGLASADELHAVFLREVADMLNTEFGVRAVVWDEGFASTGGRPGLLRPDTIVMAWRGMDIGRRAAEAGHDVIAAPVLPTYFDYSQADDPAEPVSIGGPVRVQDVAAFSPLPQDWPADLATRLIGTQFQVWTEYIRTGRQLEYMVFPRACALAQVAWAGGPDPETAAAGPRAAPAPALAARLAAHLRRLDAAGIEYRPLAGPRPWQRAGAGPQYRNSGYRIADMTSHLDGLAAGDPG